MEKNSDLLTKVDEIRKRHKVSYEEAKLALEENDYDTLDAIIFLEKEKEERLEEIKEYSDKTLESLKKTSAGNVIFSLKNKSVEAPLPVAAIGVLLMARKPKLLAACTLGLFLLGADVKIEKGDKVTELTKPLREKLKERLKSSGITGENFAKHLEDMGNNVHFGKSQKADDEIHGYFSTDVY